MENTSACFDLLVMRQTLFHLYQKLFINLLNQYHLNQMEMDILLFLANNRQFDTAKDIVNVRHLTKSHVSSSIENLVQKQFLVRNREIKNKKIIHLSLTKQAIQVVEEGRKCQEQFKTILFAGIDEKKLKTAMMILSQIFENIHQYEKENEICF